MGLARLAGFGACCFLLVSLCACQKQVPLPDKSAPRFYSLAGKPMSEADLLPLFRGADFILVGENHRSACDHAVQARIVSLAGQERPDLIVGMEMRLGEQQPVLDAFFQGRIGVDDLEEALNWKKRWGHAFALYRPVFAAVRAAGLPLCPLNLPRERIRRMAMGGEQVDFPFVPACSRQKEWLLEFFTSHKAMLGQRVDENRFLKTQALWDSVMAWNAARARKDGPVLLLAGSGHVENGWGIEYRLRCLQQSAAILRFTPIRKMAELHQFRQDNFNPGATVIFFLCPVEDSLPLQAEK